MCGDVSPGEGPEGPLFVGEGDVRASRVPLKLAFILIGLTLACGCTAGCPCDWPLPCSGYLSNSFGTASEGKPPAVAICDNVVFDKRLCALRISGEWYGFCCGREPAPCEKAGGALTGSGACIRWISWRSLVNWLLTALSSSELTLSGVDAKSLAKVLARSGPRILGCGAPGPSNSWADAAWASCVSEMLREWRGCPAIVDSTGSRLGSGGAESVLWEGLDSERDRDDLTGPASSEKPTRGLEEDAGFWPKLKRLLLRLALRL